MGVFFVQYNTRRGEKILMRRFRAAATILLRGQRLSMADWENKILKRRFMIGPTAGVNLSNMIFTPWVKDQNGF